MKSIVAITLLLSGVSSVLAQQPCAFDVAGKSFSGDPLQQAECLLREVHQWARVSNENARIPTPLRCIIGTEAWLDQEKLSTYLAEKKISESVLGGPLSEGLSSTASGHPASYLVIHDTSTPNLKLEPFPSNINKDSWQHNNLQRWMQGKDSKAHIFISRIGTSISPVPMNLGWRATKFENKFKTLYPTQPETALRGLFVHVELVQPRRSARPNGRDDAVAPDPGFTAPQYRRLAEVYMAASARSGKWLIPAFHSVLDLPFSRRHDDPQRFSLALWNEAILDLLQEVHPEIGDLASTCGQ